MSVTAIHNKEHFDSFLNDQTGTYKYVFVDFYAIWWRPCKRIAPIITELAKQYTQVKFIKVDGDQLRDIASENNISAIPTFLVFKVGSNIPLHVIVGPDEKEIIQALKTL